jgi:hypothetical protein
MTGPPRELPNPISCLSPCVCGWPGSWSYYPSCPCPGSRQSAVAESNAASISLSLASRQCFATWGSPSLEKTMAQETKQRRQGQDRGINNAGPRGDGWVAPVDDLSSAIGTTTPRHARTPVGCCSANIIRPHAGRRRGDARRVVARGQQTHMDI